MVSFDLALKLALLTKKKKKSVTIKYVTYTRWQVSLVSFRKLAS